MKADLKFPKLLGPNNFLIILIGIGILIEVWPISNSLAEGIEQFLFKEKTQSLVISQGNSLLPITNPANPEYPIVEKMRVIVTAYSSTPWETDSDPYVTAAGTWVREGIIANNLLPFGAKVKIPELFGDKIFVVEDRMNQKKSNYHIDIWFPCYWQALNFGVKNTYIEILEG